jgi:hypothetical protein
LAQIVIDIETSLPPERVHKALIDFSDRRPDIWPGLTRDLYRVYAMQETTADVQEGSAMLGMKVWAREHYDWSRDGRISWTVLESNFCTPGSGVVADLVPMESGGTHVHVTWNRTGSNLKGRTMVQLMKLTRGRLIRQSISSALTKLERAET